IVPDGAGVHPHVHTAAQICGLDAHALGPHVHHRAGEAFVTDDDVGAAPEDEQRLVGVVDLADRVDQVIGGLDGDEPGGWPAHPHRRQWGKRRPPFDCRALGRGRGLVLHQSRRTSAAHRPSTLVPSAVAVTSMVARPSSSMPVTTALTSTCAPSGGTTTMAVKRVRICSMRPASPAQSATTLDAAPIVHMPCAITSGRPTLFATSSFWWMGFWSPEALAYATRVSRPTGTVTGPICSPTLTSLRERAMSLSSSDDD